MFDIPVSKVEAVPKPNEALAVDPVSKTKFEPSPTIKPPLVTARPATSCSCASNLALATVPESCEAFIVLFVRVSVLLAVIAPMSDKTSEVLLLSRPFAVNLAYSSSATELLSILTAFVLDIPKVRLA